MACSISLQQRVIRTCERLYHFHRKHQVICGCEYNQYKGVRCNVSYLTEQQLKKLLDDKLVDKLSLLGTLGQPRPDSQETNCHFRLGNCAEVHSANDVYKQMRPEAKPEPENLSFAIPYRLSTMQPYDYCQNCKDTFSLDAIE